MRGVLSCGGYVPHYRLSRAAVSEFLGSGGGKGTRAVASYDEDTTTMGFEAARLALRAAPNATPPARVLFATVTPGYADRTNATAIHAALRLPPSVAVIDMVGSVRATAGALDLALESSRPTLVIGADVRGGLPTSGDEAAGGDGAAAVLIGSDDDGPLLAEYLGGASVTDEFVDRWRVPGDARSKLWEERFGEIKYTELGASAWRAGLADAGLDAERVSSVAVSGLHGRAVKAVGGRLKGPKVVDDRAEVVGNTGAAHPLLMLTDMIESASSGEIVALLTLADGADVRFFRVTDRGGAWKPARPLAEQVLAGVGVSYGKFLAWRGTLAVEPPRRPEPARVSSSAADRNEGWKFGFVGSRDIVSGAIEMPPAKIGTTEPVPMAEVLGTVATFTVDRLSYSPSPPIVFAVVDFDGGGRLPIELTEVGPTEVAIGMRVEMTFRRLGSSDGIHNYFWKARPIPGKGD